VGVYEVVYIWTVRKAMGKVDGSPLKAGMVKKWVEG